MRRLFLAIELLAAAGLASADPLVNRALPPVERLTAPAHGALELIRGGKPRFALVGRFDEERALRTPDGRTFNRANRDSVSRAAMTIRRAVADCCGTPPPMFDESDRRVAEYPLVVALGKTKWSEALGLKPDELPREGFEIRTFSNGVCIVGMDGFRIPGFYDEYEQRCPRLTCNGTEFGAIDFVERFLGVRAFSTAEQGLWRFVPKTDALVVAPCAYRDHPRYWTRWPVNEEWRSRVSTSFFCSEAPVPSDLAKAHPDRMEDIFYRDPDGHLWYDEKNERLCLYDVSNPKLADILVDDLKTYYAQHGTGTYWNAVWAPSTRYCWFGQCDASRFIETSRTAALQRRNPARCSVMSDIYGPFYETLARKCAEAFGPDRTLVVFAWAHYLMPPDNVTRFPDNLQVMACHGSPALVRHAGYRRFLADFYESWNAKCAPDKKCVAYTYDLSGTCSSIIPFMMRGYFEGEFLKAIRPHTAPHLVYSCFRHGGKPGRFANRLSSYLIYRALWNPDFDADAGMEDFFRTAFGAASGEHLIRLYRLLLDRWINHYLPGLERGHLMRMSMTPDQCFRSVPYVERSRLHTQTLTPDVVDALERELKAAEAALPADEAHRRRFDPFAQDFRRSLACAREEGRIAQTANFCVRPEETELPPLKKYRLDLSVAIQKIRPKMSWNPQGLTLALPSADPAARLDLAVVPGARAKHVYRVSVGSDGQPSVLRRELARPDGPVETVSSAGVTGTSERVFIPWSTFSVGADVFGGPHPGESWKLNVSCSGPEKGKRDESYVHSLSPVLADPWREDLYGTVTFGSQMVDGQDNRRIGQSKNVSEE